MDSISFPPALDTQHFRSKWAEYEEYRRDNKLAKLREKTVARRLNQYAKWGHDIAIAALDEAMTQQYQGVFYPKNAPRQTQRKMGFA